MTNLTATERKVLNNMSKVLDPDVLLGDKLQEIIGCVGEGGTPGKCCGCKSHSECCRRVH